MRSVILIYGGEVSEGYGSDEESALADALDDLDAMSAQMYEALTAEHSPEVVINYYPEG
jgi:hypothetical protein